MHQSAVRLMTAASLLLGLGAFTPVSPSGASADGNKTMSETALRIVSTIHPSWPQMPGKIGAHDHRGHALAELPEEHSCLRELAEG